MSEISKQDLKKIRSLQQKKYRSVHNMFIAEGNKVVSELLNSQIIISTIIVTNEWLQKYNNYEFNEHQPVIIAKSEFSKISNLKNPEGILAVCTLPNSNIQDINQDEWIIVLDEMKDPGNLGTIIRLADWFGINQVICSEQSVDAFNPKVVQSTMGSIGRVNVIYYNLEEFFSQYDGDVYAADLNGDSVFSVSPTKKGVVIIGNESHGISSSLKLFIDNYVTIPRIGQAESLNASIACGIIISQLTSKL